MKEARYKTQYNTQYNTQYKTSAYDENTPTVTSTGTTLLQPLGELLLNGPTEPEAEREREVYDEVVKLRERVAVLEVVVQELKYLIEAENR